MKKPGTTNSQFATDAEIVKAIEDEARNPSPRLAAAAKWILNRHPGLRNHTDEFDLLFSAYESILSDRNWDPTKVDWPTYVTGVMRSIASNETRKLSNTSPNVVYGHEERDGEEDLSITMPDEVLSPEQILIQSEYQLETDARIESLRGMLHADTEALTILNLLLEHGLTKAEIRQKLNMGESPFWAADRRLQRTIAKLGGN